LIFHVAIDGPAASGKGAAARELSRKLEIPCLDTGAIYRGVAIFAKRVGVENLEKELDKIKVTAKIENNITCVNLDGADVTGQLRQNDISTISAKIAIMPAVRKLCTKIAQDIAEKQSLICEGRDICLTVLPNAKFKFYFTAKTRIRAWRRCAELLAKGQNISYKQVLRETKERDKLDMKRDICPLARDPKAIVIDTSKKNVDQEVEIMLGFILHAQKFD
jgi:cytidylate kinase